MVGAPAGGAVLTIHGRGFCNLQLPPTVWIGAVKGQAAEVLSNSVITCIVPPGLGRNLDVWVTPHAQLFPRTPILGENGYLEIAGQTVTLTTGFSYDGNITTPMTFRGLKLCCEMFSLCLLPVER